MSKLEVKETVTVTREITGPIRDLVKFALFLQDQGIHEISPYAANLTQDQRLEQLVIHARVFWQCEHGED